MRSSEPPIGPAVIDPSSEEMLHADPRDQRAAHLCGDDPDAQWQMVESVGDEAVCGSAMTPDQNLVDDLGDAFGIRYESNEALSCGTKEFERDRHRWELNPASSEDYRERVTMDGTPAMRWRHFGKAKSEV